MKNKQHRLLKAGTLSLLLTGVLLGASAAQARPDFSACNGESGRSFGLCRAAMAAGCDKADEFKGHRERKHKGHRAERKGRYCKRLADNYLRLVGTVPMWLDQEAEPVETVAVEEPVVEDTTTTTTTTTSTRSTPTAY